ncbi:hypothetical protein WICPIJ_003100 [Wickerhamomyces pijperi]|uniref:Pyridoxamine 5'-phosphate oxidase N-terminal domain-containing protein n=1 Tax=Wickerhamomyces pijperi TaxID=599730 RepID=A0A9P8TPJ0_WICPI|nr:hypothetical protein WICPIJ_003100 [Wickerhamomyces pijperi]
MSSQELPSPVISLLKSAKYVHLATATKDGIPEVTLMNYHYLPSSELPSSCKASVSNKSYILLSSEKSVQYFNILQNPNVSLLLHDWTVAKSLNKQEDEAKSDLFKLLQNLNQKELSQLSATLSGKASVVKDSNDLQFFRNILLKENPEAKIYIEGDNNAIILVEITKFKVCDYQNNQTTYDL